MRQKLLTFFLCLCLSASAWAQNRTITGKVTDKNDGEGLPGVTVKVHGGQAATQTDGEGKYSLAVDEKAKSLDFIYMGYSTHTGNIPASGVFNVGMVDDAHALGEVVVMGYSVESAKKSTIASTAIKAAAINDIPVSDINQVLQGQAPGVIANSNSGQPGGRSEVRIRGIGSISGPSAPLYVIDGVISPSGDYTQNTTTQDVLSNMNPDDIESITILKDAAGVALYGSRGANGVIVITTKRGKQGLSSVNFSAQYGSATPIAKIDLMNSSQLLQYHRELLRADGKTEAEAKQIRPDYLANNSTDWFSEGFKPELTQRYNFSASGGNEKTKYYTSAEYFDQGGVVIGSSLNRYGVRINADHKVSDKFDLSANLNLSKTLQNSAATGTTFASPILGGYVNSPFVPITDVNGNISDGFSPGQPGTATYQGFASIPAGFVPTLFGGNFLNNVKYDFGTSSNNQSVAGLTFGWNMIPGLRLAVKGNANVLSIAEKEWRDGRGYNGADYKGLLYDFNVNMTTYNLQEQLNYTKSFASGHTISGLLVNEFEFQDYAYSGAEVRGFASNDLPYAGSGTEPTGNYGSAFQSAFHSVLTKVDYDYMSKYFLGASLRVDGSSRFAKDNRYGAFYSLSGAWRMKEEGFLQSVDWISEMKLRASLGTAGNATLYDSQGINYYPYQELYALDASYDGDAAAYPSQVPNPALTWEKTNALDFGLDYALLDNRIWGSVGFYNKKTANLLLARPLSQTSGFLAVNSNIGSLQNRGWEVTLGGMPIKSKDFTWSLDLNFATLSNKVLALVEGQQFIAAGTQRIEVGRPLGSWFMAKWAGVDPANGDPLWYDKDGNTTNDYGKAERQFVGTLLPKITGGLSSNMTFKGVDFSFLFSFSAGNQGLNNTAQFLESDGMRTGMNQAVNAADRWQKPGDNASRPKAVWGNGNNSASLSSRWLEDLSYVRLKNVSLGYTLPKGLLKGIAYEKVRVFVQAQNLLTLTKFSGLDPDISTAPQSPTYTSGNAGSDFFRYPSARMYTFGVSVGF